jgi:hypothetical protein
MSSRGSGAAALVTAVAAATLAGCVSPVPMTLSESFSNPEPHPLRFSKGTKSCDFIVALIADMRTEPALLGTVTGRPVRAPEDVQAWLRNVLSGLESRGVSPHFDTNPTHEATPLVADMTLRLAWVSEIHTSKTATTLLHMKLSRGEKVIAQRDYRGSDTVMNWSAGDGELQRMVDRAFGTALDQIAVDLRAACRAPST